MMLLIGAAALLLAGPRDSASVLSKSATPTIKHAPVVGVRSMVIADSIVVEKGKRTLTLFSAGLAVRTYKVALGLQPLGDKVKKGDNRTPEGTYFIDFKNPQSKYYKALHISYPDAAHQERARELGVPAGGDVMIHGLPDRFKSYGESQADNDWTEGCIALSDQQMDEIWRDVPVGTPILIKP